MPAASPASPALISLDDKYTLDSGRVYLTGTQALVRLMMLQRQRDQRAGLDTSGYVTGYRGSPLGAVDQQMWKAKAFLDRAHIRFQPGVNEDLAATACWGTQQVNIYPSAAVDGVFAMWYGKGPGVDRCGDVFKHANMAGTSKHGGVLLLLGDDHGAKSSTVAHQSDHAMSAAMIPVLNPAGVQEYLDLGVHAFAMSRYSGCWVSMKCVTDTVEASASVYVDPDRVEVVVPDDFPVPPEGVHIRWPDHWLDQERRMHDYKIYMAVHYARVNALNRIVIDSPRPRLGIITTGKSFLDVMQALADLGIDDAQAAEIGIRVFKVAMSWPLEPEGVRQFAEGLDEVLVVEEKRQLIEYQLKEQLYNWREDVRPRVIGKFDEKGEWVRPHGDWLLPASGELTPAIVARVIAGRIGRFYTSGLIEERLAFLAAKEKALLRPRLTLARTPYFCSGCPHNTSTRVPEGSRAMAGIGCHFMATWMDRSTSTFSHMGGEGAAWIGQAPFTRDKHVFVNLGDGTYFHSGLLALRAAVAAGVNITYKILFNDAVAMTGGQPVDGTLNPALIAAQVAAEGVARVVCVTDEPEKYPGGYFPGSVSVHGRDELDRVQRELRETAGVTVLIYDQTCAAEKRRRRKRGTFPDPQRRAFINEHVCEGCGDCGVKSNCVSVIPVETEFGRKRAIDQSNCNKDFSCLNGFCPSFVTIEGGKLRRPGAAGDIDFAPLPDPAVPGVERPWNILVTGIGGTGVVTIGQLLGVAAHIEGKGVSVLDMAGLAQKNGAVMSHIRIGRRPEDLHATRIAAGEADLVLGGDLVVTAGGEALSRMRAGRTRAIINTAQVMPADFTRTPDLAFPAGPMEREIAEAVGAGAADFVAATRLATALMGDSIATNLFLLGYAWQKGTVPVSEEAILKAIELNAVAVESNRRSFVWGRRAAVDPARVGAIASPTAVKADAPDNDSRRLSESLDESIERRVAFLTDYQDSAYARRYRAFVDRVRSAEAARAGQAHGERLTAAVAQGYFRLLAIKDEYEVARLYTASDFLARVAETFEGDFRLRFHLAPPLLARPDPATGEVRKRTYGPWMLTAMRLLARLKFLRGGAFDVFGRTAERRMERQLITNYETTLAGVLEQLGAHNLEFAVAIATLPDTIRGFGHVKARNLAAAQERERDLLTRFAEAGAPRPVGDRVAA